MGRKRRAPGVPRRFHDLQQGAVLIHRAKYRSEKAVPTIRPVANSNVLEETLTATGLAVVSDRWFDPVAGQHDRWAGEMAGLRLLTSRGLGPNKTPHTLRGLAQQGYHPTTPEQQRLASDWLAARVQLMLELDSGRVTLEEARLRAQPWAQLMRELGLED